MIPGTGARVAREGVLLGTHTLGQMVGKGPWLHCHNKDQVPSSSPAVHIWHTNVLHVKDAGTFGTLPKNVADPFSGRVLYRIQSGS